MHQRRPFITSTKRSKLMLFERYLSIQSKASLICPYVRSLAIPSHTNLQSSWSKQPRLFLSYTLNIFWQSLALSWLPQGCWMTCSRSSKEMPLPFLLVLSCAYMKESVCLWSGIEASVKSWLSSFSEMVTSTSGSLVIISLTPQALSLERGGFLSVLVELNFSKHSLRAASCSADSSFLACGCWAGWCCVGVYYWSSSWMGWGKCVRMGVVLFLLDGCMV